MAEDLTLFNELIRNETPDVNVDEKLFAYYSDAFKLEITKAAEVQIGPSIKSMYKLTISGDLNITRFINNKDNALIKAHLLINEYYKSEPEITNEDEDINFEYLARTYIDADEFYD